MHSPADALKRSPNTASPIAGQVPLATADTGGLSYGQAPGNPPAHFALDALAHDGLAGTNLDPTLFPPNPYSSSPTQAFPDLSNLNPNSSNQLVRRSANNQLATRSPVSNQQQWLSPTQPPGRAWEDLGTEEDELNAKAALAKREAQAKRKQIPPFVLKLWSFLNEDKNTNLIRWTDNGNAFTVLDEDEFARTLIPELFKHNNYASFVRQLNMYGFHKKVGLNANSMKAAERKTKDPNVYWHEYFRQGREDLLWLIQKPQTKSTTTKRKRGQDGKEADSDDEREFDGTVDNANVGKLKQGDSDLTVLPKTEVAVLRQEVQKLQRQQGLITKMIGQLKDQNEQFYRQASEFQSMHERHENSINAILTFLATFYNRSLEAGVDLANMFGNQGTPSQQQGSVVDVGDNEFPVPNTQQQLQRYRKPQLLLQSSPAREAHARQVSTQPNSNRDSVSPPQSAHSNDSSRKSNSPTIKEDADTPNITNQGTDVGGVEDMMAMINAANAATPSSSTPQFDFSSALNHAQNANGANPLTPQQRTNMLNLIAAQQPGASNNALTTPNPPPMPDLHQYARNQEQLEILTRLQKEQDSKVQDLAGRLQPLSPNGSIPGLPDSYMTAGGGPGGTGLSEPGDFDFDAFLQNPYAGDGNFGDVSVGGVNPGQDPSAELNFDFGEDVPDTDNLFGDVPDDSGGTAGQDKSRVQSVHSESDGHAGAQS